MYQEKIIKKRAGLQPRVIPHPGESTQQGKAGRPFWSGSITIGLVNVPVRLHTMVRDLSVSFRLLHKADGQPLRYDRAGNKGRPGNSLGRDCEGIRGTERGISDLRT